MPKTLVLSNGNLLIGFDKKAQVRDFYFPYVGLENHTGGNFVHKIGIWVRDRFSWMDDPGWDVSVTYQVDSLVGKITAINPELQVTIGFTDTVYNEKDIFLREVTVTNSSSFAGPIKIFFNQQFMIYESARRDTAYYDPRENIVVHYEGRRVFLINAITDNRGFDDYSTGLFGIEGKLGTYKDAEDGKLNQNPIEHGQVDSTIGLTLDIEAGQTKTVYYWITVSKLMEEAYELNRFVLSKSPGYLINSTRNYWIAWTNRQNMDFSSLPAPVVDLYKKSLLIIRTHVDNRGAILASCDSDLLQYGRDTYGYVWPRDGAFSAVSLDQAGDHEVARRFFEFCNHIITPDGYFMHKYRSDESLGSSWHPWVRNGRTQFPIQEDETALVIYALWKHYTLTKDLEFIEGIYNSLIKKAAEFMVSYRDPETGLPLPSYDIWEEKWGTHTFTAASVFAALTSAGKFADLLGKTESAIHYKTAARQIQEGIVKYLYDPEAGYFYKSFLTENGTRIIDKTIDISSVYGVFKFGVLSADDDKLTRAVSLTLYNLGLTTLVGGVARYEKDQYLRKDPNVPGNPWFIATLWLAQYYLTQVKKPDDTASVARLLIWVTKHAMPSGILSEQLDPNSGDQLSAAPLTWSHSEYIITVLEYLKTLSVISSRT